MRYVITWDLQSLVLKIDSWRRHKRDRDSRFTEKPGGCADPNGSTTERRESEHGPRLYVVENTPRLYQLWCSFFAPPVRVLDVIQPRSSSPLDLSPGTITRTPHPLKAREIVRPKPLIPRAEVDDLGQVEQK